MSGAPHEDGALVLYQVRAELYACGAHVVRLWRRRARTRAPAEALGGCVSKPDARLQPPVRPSPAGWRANGQHPPAWGLPTTCPRCLAAHALLRWGGLGSFQTDSGGNSAVSPTGQAGCSGPRTALCTLSALPLRAVVLQQACSVVSLAAGCPSHFQPHLPAYWMSSG